MAIGVAVLDTGIWPHVDFGNRIDFFYDFVAGKQGPYDDNGHGTHVTGILAGDGTRSGGKIRGVAPECKIISLKVLDEKGHGKKQILLKAFQWILEYGEGYGIRVVNISLGMPYSKENEQLLDGVDALWEKGYVVVAAAGNRGPCPGSVTVPGCSERVITVGCSDLIEGKGAVSGCGPTFACVSKPDIVAPGKNIVACAPKNVYSVKSGTSMATPYVAGLIARLLEKNPAMTNVDIKMRLKKCAKDMGLPRNRQGWGKIDEKKFLKL